MMIFDRLSKTDRKRVRRIARRRTWRSRWVWGSKTRRLVGRYRKQMQSHTFHCPELCMTLTFMWPKVNET